MDKNNTREYTMNIDEYHESIDKFLEQDKLDEVCNLQKLYMGNVLKQLKAKADKTKSLVDIIAHDLVYYAYYDSESGNAIIFSSDYESYKEENLDDLTQGIWERIGDYLLDIEVNEECVDVIFGGAYVPQWFELNDEW